MLLVGGDCHFATARRPLGGA